MFRFRGHSAVSEKEGVSPEQEKWSSSLNHKIKEEPEELWSTQEGKQLQGPEEEDFNFTYVPGDVKSEEDEEKPQSSTKQMETGADGEPEEAEFSYPESDLQPETDESPDPETDDSADWMETTAHHSGLKLVEKITKEGAEAEREAHGCSECGKRFKNNCEKPFSCSECGKMFTQRGSMTTEMRVHIGEFSFGCPECGKRFNSRKKLNNHLRVHSTEKPFSCSVCGASFKRKGSFRRHNRIHEGVKPHSCSKCGKKFAERKGLNSHMKTHAELSCSRCGKIFKLKCSLRAHQAVHRVSQV